MGLMICEDVDCTVDDCIDVETWLVWLVTLKGSGLYDLSGAVVRASLSEPLSNNMAVRTGVKGRSGAVVSASTIGDDAASRSVFDTFGSIIILKSGGIYGCVSGGIGIGSSFFSGGLYAFKGGIGETPRLGWGANIGEGAGGSCGGWIVGGVTSTGSAGWEGGATGAGSLKDESNDGATGAGNGENGLSEAVVRPSIILATKPRGIVFGISLEGFIAAATSLSFN